MDGRTDGRTDDGRTGSQKLCPSAFLRKGGGQKNNSCLRLVMPDYDPCDTIEPSRGKTYNVASEQVGHIPTCTVTEKS